MLYKHDIEDRSDIIVGKSSFTFHTKHTQQKQQSQIYFIHERLHVTLNSRRCAKRRRSPPARARFGSRQRLFEPQLHGDRKSVV